MTAVPVAQGNAGDDVSADDSGRPMLVVGVDGSAPSWDALAWAAGEAKRGNGRIVAVFVTPAIQPEEALGSTAPLGYAAAVDARDQVAEELADEVARRCRRARRQGEIHPGSGRHSASPHGSGAFAAC